MDENVVTFLQVFDSAGLVLGRGDCDRPTAPGVMDVVWWMTGLSPTKYDAEPIPNMRAWKIVRRWPNAGEYHAGRVGG